LSITCPVCSAWTSVKETRTRKTDGVVTRRYECANLHRFTTEERIRYDNVLQRQLQPRPGLSGPGGEGWAAYENR